MPNKVHQSIKEMVEKALHKAGGVEYLTRQATENPVAFMGLVGKVLPLQITGSEGGALVVDFRWADAPPTIDANVATAAVGTDAATDANDPPAITFISDC